MYGEKTSKKSKLILLTVRKRGIALMYLFPFHIVFVHSTDVNLICLASMQI